MKKADTSSPWRDGFLFVGNQLALDFLNTRPVEDGQTLELLPDFDALLRWFQTAGFADAARIASPRGGRVFGELLHFREQLRTEVLSWESGASVRRSTIDRINRWMADYPSRARVKTSGKKLIRETLFRMEEPEDLFGPLAAAAASLFTEAARDRVRKCGHCVLHFLDTSKRGTRRWCSMQLCGNRVKVAAYAARHR